MKSSSSEAQKINMIHRVGTSMERPFGIITGEDCNYSFSQSEDIFVSLMLMAVFFFL